MESHVENNKNGMNEELNIHYILVWTILLLLVWYCWSCELFPSIVTRWNSNAWSSMVRWNIGPESHLFQAVLYDLFHHSTLGQVTHHCTLVIDVVHWFAFFISFRTFLGQFIFILCNIFMTYQAKSYSLPMLQWTGIQLGIHMFSHTMVKVYAHLVGEHYVSFVLMMMLLITSVIRVVGHGLGEATPPIIFDGTKPQGKFKWNVVTWRGWLNYILNHGYGDRYSWSALLWSPVIGILSELQAGVPYRLILIVFSKYIPGWRTLEFKQQIELTMRLIRKNGWQGWPLTKILYHDLLVQSDSIT